MTWNWKTAYRSFYYANAEDAGRYYSGAGKDRHSGYRYSKHLYRAQRGRDRTEKMATPSLIA